MDRLHQDLGMYRALARNFPNGALILFDTDLRYVIADGDGLAAAGLSPSMLEGRTVDQVFPPETVAIIEPAYRAALAGRDSTIEVPFGDIVYRMHARPVRDASGEITAGLVMTQDITAQKSAEASLRTSEERFRAMVENVADGIALIDAKGMCIYQAPSVKRLWGREPGELVGRNGFELVHPDDMASLAASLASVAATPGAREVAVFRAMHKDGTYRWTEATGTNLLNEPAVRAIVINYREISERRRSEDVLRVLAESTGSATGEPFLRSLTRHLADTLAIKWAHIAELTSSERVRTVAVRADGRFAPDFEYDLAGTPCSGVIVERREVNHPCDVQSKFPENLSLRRMGVDSYLGIPLTAPDGEVLGLLVVMDAKPMAGTPHALSIVRIFAARAAAELVRHRAEQALRRSEELNRRLLESVPGGIVHVTRDGAIVHANDLAMRFLELDFSSTSRTYVADYGTSTIWEDGTPCRVEDYPVTHCLATGLAQGPKTLGIRRSNGETGWGVFSALPMPDVMLGGSGGGGAVVTFLDITERKRLEDQLRQSQKMDAIGKLAGGVAHDFNNLLTVILGRSELLLDRLDDADPIREDIRLFHTTALRGAGLTRQLLTFSRQQVTDPRVLDLNTVVVHMGELLRNLIGEHIELRTVLEPHLGRAKADPGQIEQVILNLCVNARDAMPDGGTLTIQTANAEVKTATPELPAGRYVMLAVKDTGHGIDAKIRSRIFEPFFTTKGLGKGTGLGLSTVFGIVSQSGGRLSVISESGKGSVFMAYLPRANEDARAQPASETPVGRSVGSETVLLVEDHEDVRAMLGATLGCMGYRVVEASHGTEALALSDRHAGPIHLLITDVIMPGMNGRELARRLLEKRQATKVLYVSGYTDDRLGSDTFGPGAAFLQKPFSNEALSRTVRELIDGPAVAQGST